MHKQVGITSAGLPNFIVDAPADVDAFQAHAPVARALAQLVRSPSEIRMIGIMGGWGSGKSTIVRLLEKDLAFTPSKEPILCFNYDTWLRQNELPRRAFLEGLIAFLEAEELPQVGRKLAEWKEQLEKLSGSIETTTTATQIEVSLAGRFLLPALLFMPLGWKLIGDGVLKLDDQPFRANWLAFSLGWALTAAPLFIGVMLLWCRIVSPHDLLGVFTNKPPEVKQETKARSPEPSAMEFQEMFQDIVLTVKGAGHRLLMVIDNLDRLPTGEALTLWATLRSFFLEARSRTIKVDRRDLPVVIVPLDPGAPARIHGEGAGKSEGGEGEDSFLNQSFVEKTFDIVFHVPQPVLSRWQDYLRTKLTAVLGAVLDEKDHFAVVSVYEGFHRREPKRVLTAPRSLNSFANALAVLWLQRSEDAISAAAMAFMVCNREVVEDNIQTALQSDLANLEGHDPDWRNAVAALHFGVPKALASELFMGEPIRSALEGEDPSELGRLAQVPGFDTYLDQVLRALGHDAILPAARCLVATELESPPWLPEAWRTLRGRASVILQQHAPAPKDDAGLLALIRSAPEGRRGAFILTMQRVLLNIPSDQLMQHAATHTSAVLKAISAAAGEAGLSNFRITLPADVQLYIDLLAQGGTPAELAAIDAQQPPPVVIERLSIMLVNPDTAETAAVVAGAYAEVLDGEGDWSKMLSTIESQFEQGDPRCLAAGFRALVGLASHAPDIGQRVSQWANARQLAPAWSRLSWAELTDGDLAAALAVMMMATVEVRPNDGSDWPSALDQHGELPLLLLRDLRRFLPGLSLAWLREGMQALPALAPVFRAVAALIVSAEDDASIGTAVLKDLGGYFDLLGPTASLPLWTRLSQTPGFWAALAELPLERSGGIYIALAGAEGPKSQLGKRVKARLQDVPQDEWSAILQPGDPPSAFLPILRSLKNSSLTLDEPLATALRNAIEAMVTSGNLPLRARWFELSRWLAPAARRTAIAAAARAVVALHFDDLPQLLSAGGTALVAEDGLLAIADDAARVLLPKLLETPSGSDWATKNVDVVVTWLRGSRFDTKASMRGLLGNAPAAGRGVADRIRENWEYQERHEGTDGSDSRDA